jgi:hypothetical protein
VTTPSRGGLTLRQPFADFISNLRGSEPPQRMSETVTAIVSRLSWFRSRSKRPTLRQRSQCLRRRLYSSQCTLHRPTTILQVAARQQSTSSVRIPPILTPTRTRCYAAARTTISTLTTTNCERGPRVRHDRRQSTTAALTTAHKLAQLLKIPPFCKLPLSTPSVLYDRVPRSIRPARSSKVKKIGDLSEYGGSVSL